MYTIEVLYSEYSDTYKDAFGHRPTSFPSHSIIESEIAQLHNIVLSNIKFDTIVGSEYLLAAREALELHKINSASPPKNNPFEHLLKNSRWGK